MKKSFSKILTALMIMAVMLSAIQFTAFASETDVTATPAASVTDAAGATPAAEATPAAYGVEVAMYLMESSEEWSYGDMDAKEWSEPKSESVFIKEDGTYTVSLTDLDIPAEFLMLCYIKDVAAYPKDSKVKQSNLPEDTMVVTDEFKVNGSKKSVSDLVRTGLKDGLFDVAYRNDWADTDNCVEFFETINSIEITFTVTGITGEPGAIKYEPTTAPTPVVAADTAAATDADTADAADTVAATDSEAKSDTGFSTGLIIGIVAGAVILVCAIIVIIVKKKK